MAIQKLDLFKKLVLVCSGMFFLFFILVLVVQILFATHGTPTTAVPKSLNVPQYTPVPIKLSKGKFTDVEAVKNSSIIYAGGSGILAQGTHSLYKSNDGGSTWFALNTPLITTISALNKETVYVGSSKGMGKTVNGGTNWFPIGLGSHQIIQVQAVDFNTVYAITTAPYLINGGNLYKTQDAGHHWNKIYSSNWSAPITFYAVNKDVVYVGLKRGLMSKSKLIKTIDGGNSWSTVFVGEGNTRFKQIYAVDEHKVFLATSTGIYKTLNGGISWYVCTNNLPFSSENKEYGFTGIYAKDAQTIYVSYSFPYSVYLTHDGGGYWKNINMGGSVYGFSGFGTKLYVGTQMGLFELKGN
jgi:photosystem II stability/assembly factor-like uncharacterized protein